MKRIITVMLILTLLLLCFTQPVFANSPGPNLDGSYEPQPGGVAIVIILYLIAVAFTCLVEWLVCIPFKMHYVYSRVIITTNLTTQVIMHLVQRLVLAFVPTSGFDTIALYIATLTILEIAVMTGEFFIYRKKVPGYSIPTLLLYVLSANAASAFGGLLLFMIILL